ncbi:MAG: hypothetical protein HUJ59_03880 [Bacilli bacterium]|nr:hypothetical protein [Bacilli bacterium]
MNLTKILNPIYLDFFSAEQCKYSHRIFRMFVDDVTSVNIYEDVTGYVPMNTLKELNEKAGYRSNYYAHIKDIIKNVNKMNKVEVFTLLYCACSRDNFNFNVMFAEECANNGIIYECLRRLKEIK